MRFPWDGLRFLAAVRLGRGSGLPFRRARLERDRMLTELASEVIRIMRLPAGWRFVASASEGDLFRRSRSPASGLACSSCYA